MIQTHRRVPRPDIAATVYAHGENGNLDRGSACDLAHARYNVGVRAPPSLAIAALSLCLGCGDEHPVPFGLETPHPEPTTAPPTTTASITDAAEWAEGAEVRVDDTPIVIEGAHVRATLASDLDADGDRDVLFLASTADGALSFGVATRTPTGLTFAAPLPIAGVCAPVAITSARLLSFSTELVAARIERACGASSEQRIVVLRTTPAPRVLETLAFAPNAGETMTARGEDRDDDGHLDVVVHLSLHDASGESADVDLAWLDRAAGLSRDTAEPEATIVARAGEARSAVRRHPDRALAATRTAVLVHDALCGTTARLAIDDDLGIACPASVGLGRALAIAAAAEAHQGHLPEALAAVIALSRSDATVRDADRTVARDALAAMTGVLHPVTNEGPEARAVGGGDTVRLSTLAFLSEDRVLVRGDGAHVVTLSSGVSEPSLDGEVGMVDAERHHALAEIERACSGYVLVVRPVFGPLDSPSDQHTSALIEAHAPPAGASCADATVPPTTGTPPELTIQQRRDTGGWRALGWAPQGALVARESTLVLVPLDVAGASLGAPSTLASDEPAPAPIAPGHATADASAWALTTSVGLVLYRRSQPPALVMPSSFARADGTAIDVAVSPSAQRLAWIEGGHLRWIDLSAPPPAPPATTTP